ncbi:hypothetical protein CKF54_01730 [Psittacicella hinzii]|uniref:Septum formation initiator n=1 Tax=Psittacicella hinzii TaxID=2028575 RepID=A0A3A1YDF8_9GAMM|nr:septum formation initiator family protein [Psittacicella hinzii]RIY34177.1 hypothetical protein CKF54_01730 [Psittacicella hinzii]
MGLRLFNFILVCAIGYLVYGIIIGRNGYIYLNDMKYKIAEQTQINAKLQQDNAYLQQRVEALKSGNLFTYESFARRQLNYIRKDEVFFRIIDNRVLPNYYSKDDNRKYIPAPNSPILNPNFSKRD